MINKSSDSDKDSEEKKKIVEQEPCTSEIYVTFTLWTIAFFVCIWLMIKPVDDFSKIKNSLEDDPRINKIISKKLENESIKYKIILEKDQALTFKDLAMILSPKIKEIQENSTEKEIFYKKYGSIISMLILSALPLNVIFKYTEKSQNNNQAIWVIGLIVCIFITLGFYTDYLPYFEIYDLNTDEILVEKQDSEIKTKKSLENWLEERYWQILTPEQYEEFIIKYEKEEEERK